METPFPWSSEPPPSGSGVRIRMRAIRESIKHLGRRPFITFSVWLLIGISLALPAGFWLLDRNIRAITQDLSDDTGLTVYFETNVSINELSTTTTRIESDPIVHSISLTTPQQAFEDFRNATGYVDELSVLDENPLPASLSIRVRDDADRTQVDRLAARLEEISRVSTVVVDTEWMLRLLQLQKIVSRLTWILGSLFGIGVVFVTVAAIRLAIASGFDELRIISLLGGSDRYLRRPFTYCGFLYGCGGGLVATTIVVVALVVIDGPLLELAQSYGGEINIVAMNYTSALALIAIGGVLGLTGALYVTLLQMRKQRYLDEWS